MSKELVKIERIVPRISDTISDIKRRAEEMNPGYQAISYRMEGPILSVNLRLLQDESDRIQDWMFGQVGA